MIRRVVGLETEYGLAYDAAGTAPLTVEEVAKRLFAPVMEWGRSTNVFLFNGSRLYLDVGSHPEIATAECVVPSELLEQDRAGVLSLAWLVSTAEESLRAEGHGGRLHLFRNNVDSAGNSFGCHENYLIPRRLEYRRLTEQLLPFLVTRQLLCGAGHVVRGPEGARMVLSQRAEHMWEGVSSSSTRSRPMINTRDEPHADAERYRRLHVIVGDTNMAEGSTLLKTVSASLILSVLETGRVMPDWSIANPVKALRDISRDADGTTAIALADGRTVTALEVQEYFLDVASDHADAAGLRTDSDVATALELWGRTLEAWRAGDPGAVGDTLDYAAKRSLLARYTERHGVGLEDARVARLELAYHDVAPGAGLRDGLEARGLLRRFTDPARVEAARDTPPSGSRAVLRSRFLRAARAAGVDHQVDWLTLKLTAEPPTTVQLPDPFATSDPAAEALIDALLG